MVEDLTYVMYLDGKKIYEGSYKDFFYGKHYDKDWHKCRRNEYKLVVMATDWDKGRTVLKYEKQGKNRRST